MSNLSIAKIRDLDSIKIYWPCSCTTCDRDRRYGRRSMMLKLSMAEVSEILRKYDLYWDKVNVIGALRQAAAISGDTKVSHIPSLAAVAAFVDELRFLASPNREASE